MPIYFTILEYLSGTNLHILKYDAFWANSQPSRQGFKNALAQVLLNMKDIWSRNICLLSSVQFNLRTILNLEKLERGRWDHQCGKGYAIFLQKNFYPHPDIYL